MPVTPAGLRWNEEVDIGVVGAGACGLAAAHAASGNRLRVTVWERAREPGGTTALGGGCLAAAGSRLQREAGITDSADDFYADIMARNGRRSDPALTRRLCELSGELVDWLTDGVGLDLTLLRLAGDPGHRRPRLHAPGDRNGQAMVEAMAGQAIRRGARLRLVTPVLHLWTDVDGGVLGVQIKSPKRSATNVRCHKLLLATDGFGANSTLVAQHVAEAASLTYAGAATSTGDAVLWGGDAGAAQRDMGAYYAHPYATVGANLPVPWDVFGAGAILVNQLGERFMNEMSAPASAVPAICSQPGRIAYVIFGSATLKEACGADAYFAHRIAPRAVRRAEDAAGLAAQFQIGAEALVKTVAAYNDACRAGNDSFGRTQLGSGLEPPLHGIRVSPALFATQGGLVVDTDARVLRPDGTPVPNLYAGGSAGGGLAGPGGDGYLLGTGLLCAFGLGRLAGMHAATAVCADRAAATAVTPSDVPDA
ncbi:FAD-dependent oxidoreductase [Candidatus Binatia bacterium]|nr:FAD-dependent oxidoreductase [Candidatus Binatia bacterium]